MRGLITTGLLLLGLVDAGGASAQATGGPERLMIFFDWGKFEIQRDYAAMLDAAAATFQAGSGGTVTIEGHSDRSGPAFANRQASRRRAEAVRDYLRARGIPAGALVVRALGEDAAIIATADGVREPQNRRVDVRLIPVPGR